MKSTAQAPAFSEAVPAARPRGGIIAAVRSSRLLRRAHAGLMRRFGGCPVRTRGTGHRLSFADSRISGGRISITGTSNTLEIGEGARLWDVNVELHGSGLICRIGADCRIRGGTLVVEDAGSRLEIGEATTLIMAVVVSSEGHRVRLGADCLVASGADIRNSDGHSVIDREGRRVNPAGDVEIGRHVWLGLGCQVLKGVTIDEGSVVAARSLVNRDVPARTVVAGTPARVIREDTSWDARRL